MRSQADCHSQPPITFVSHSFLVYAQNSTIVSLKLTFVIVTESLIVVLRQFSIYWISYICLWFLWLVCHINIQIAQNRLPHMTTFQVRDYWNKNLGQCVCNLEITRSVKLCYNATVSFACCCVILLANNTEGYSQTRKSIFVLTKGCATFIFLARDKPVFVSWFAGHTWKIYNKWCT
jgi:hypothetical protein